MPYTDIAAHPNNFYDTDHFSLRLDKPLAEMSLSQLSGMIEYLISISATDHPFIFRAKEDILARRASSAAVQAPPPPVLPSPPALQLLPSASPPALPPVRPQSPPPTRPQSSLPVPPQLPPSVPPQSLPPPVTPVEVNVPPKTKKRKAAAALEPADEGAEDSALGRGRRTRRSPQVRLVC